MEAGEVVVRRFVRRVECDRYWSPANSVEDSLLAGSFCVRVRVCVRVLFVVLRVFGSGV